jgi:hypothetical protein
MEENKMKIKEKNAKQQRLNKRKRNYRYQV